MAVYRQSPASNYGVPPMWYSSITGQYYQSKEAAEASEQSSPEYKEQQQKEQNVENLTKQILSQNTMDKWSGEGFGSAEANAKGMAEALARAGITDIRQFGVREVERPVFVADEYGSGFVGTEKVKEYFNKATGQAVNPEYAFAGGDIWSGTFAGSGRTNFGVQFAPDGTPYFYTQHGGSSSDMDIIAPALGIGLMFVPGLQGLGASIGSALAPAASAAVQAGIGNAIVQGAISEATGGDFLKGAALSGVSSLAGGLQPGLSEALGGGNVGQIASNALIGGAMSELSGGDFAQGALLSGVQSGIQQAKLSAAEDYLRSLPTEGYNVATAPTEADILDVIAAESPNFQISDTSFTPNYSLSSGASGEPGLVLKPLDTQYQVGSFDYTLGDLMDGLGLQMPTTPNLDSMGGGQGIVVKTNGGYITEQGFIPDSYVASLGDPESFINKPVIDVGLSLGELKEATPEDISNKLAGLDIAKALAPAALAALTKKVIDTIDSDKASGFAVVPVPSDWKSPEYNMAFTPSAPIDFGSRELLRGTQWENPQITAPNAYNLTNLINTLNMESVPFVQQNYQVNPVPFEMPDILQQFNVAPTVGMTDIIGNLNSRPVSIADIIAGIQSGQNYNS